jgi:AcrR family transcriptional regulator
MRKPVRDRICAAAIELFTEKGYAATATREICERARVTKPALYYHFEDKEHLYRELVLGAWEGMFRELSAAAQRGSCARERLVNVLSADFALTVREPDLAAMHFRMIFAPRQETSGLDMVQVGLDWVKLLAGIAREGVQKGELQGSPRKIAEAILGIHLIYTMSYLLRGTPKLDRNLARSIVNLLWKGCVKNHRNR